MKVIKFESKEKGSCFLMVKEEDSGIIGGLLETGQKGSWKVLDVSEKEYNSLPEWEGF